MHLQEEGKESWLFHLDDTSLPESVPICPLQAEVRWWGQLRQPLNNSPVNTGR